MTRALVFALALCGASVAEAQWNVSFGATAAQEIAQSRVGTTRERVSGLVLGAEAVASRGRFAARLRYGQGRVTNDTAGRDVAEGEALLGYKARPWLTVWVGPHARTFVVPGQSDRRWLLWSGRVTARGSLFPGRVESFVELWQGVTGSLNRPAESASGGGAEAGLVLRLARHPVWGRLAYRIEQGRVSGGARRETVEAITLTIGYVPVR
ncbi:MAG TPA: hypothetical protein VK573_06660 [Gemmatimonadales bacterium]|nr:hypothetical protein [Gemmatimonadales bacterium]